MKKVLIILMVGLFLGGCKQAPKSVSFGMSKAMTQVEAMHEFSKKRLVAYNKNLALEQDNHRSTIFKDRIALLTKDGKVDSSKILELFKMLKDKENDNRKKLEKHAKLDMASEKLWKNFAKIMAAIKRYLASGMSEEDRQKFYEDVVELAEESFKTIKETEKEAKRVE